MAIRVGLDSALAAFRRTSGWVRSARDSPRGLLLSGNRL